MRESRSSGSVGGEGATSSPTRHPWETKHHAARRYRGMSRLKVIDRM